MTTVNNKIGVACDHAGYPLMQFVRKYLTGKGFSLVDVGTLSPSRCDYPDFGHALAEKIEVGEISRGVAICGTGLGISMALNKHASIRAALCWIPEIARLSRQHNDANVLVLPGRYMTPDLAAPTIDTWLSTSFLGGRHAERIAKIPLH